MTKETTRFFVKTTPDKLKMFEAALATMHLDRHAYIDATMKQAVLNSLTLIEDYGIPSTIQVDDAKKEFMTIWRSKVIGAGHNSPLAL